MGRPPWTALPHPSRRPCALCSPACILAWDTGPAAWKAVPRRTSPAAAEAPFLALRCPRRRCRCSLPESVKHERIDEQIRLIDRAMSHHVPGPASSRHCAETPPAHFIRHKALVGTVQETTGKTEVASTTLSIQQCGPGSLKLSRTNFAENQVAGTVQDSPPF